MASCISVGKVNREQIERGLGIQAASNMDAAFDATLSWDATFLVKKVRVIGECKVLGVSEEQAKQFEQGRIMLNSLTPLFSSFVFIVTPVCAIRKAFVAHIYFTAHANFRDDIK